MKCDYCYEEIEKYQDYIEVDIHGIRSLYCDRECFYEDIENAIIEKVNICQLKRISHDEKSFISVKHYDIVSTRR